YFTGSVASNNRRLSVSSQAVFQSDCLRSINPSFRATRSTCTSHGQTNAEGFNWFHKPKSTPRSSRRTIQRKNMFNRLHAELLAGELMCLRVRTGYSGKPKKH